MHDSDSIDISKYGDIEIQSSWQICTAARMGVGRSKQRWTHN